MPKKTPKFGFHTLDYGDIWYPGNDQDNMQAVERQIAARMAFFGSGVVSGWDVESFSGADWKSEQVELIEAYLDDPDSFQGQQLQYLDLSPTHTVKASSSSNITLSGAQTIDGVSIVANDKVLVRGQTNKTQNGVYTAATGSWSREPSLNESSEWNESIVIHVTHGTSNSNTLWIVQPQDSYDLGVDELHLSDAFTQVVRVSAGSGIIGSFHARTAYSFYFRYQSSGLYYLWAEKGPCLITEGIAQISSPSPADYDYDLLNDAAYLGTVVVIENGVTLTAFISDIEYEEKRNQLMHLEGALQRALGDSFAKHVHLGRTNTAPKINLSTYVTLTAKNNVGATILELIGEDGELFSWDGDQYGVPLVFLNSQLLSSSLYSISPIQGLISIPNSLSLGDTILVKLPVSRQTELMIHPDSQPSQSSVFLTDELGSSRQRIYTWDESLYHSPVVTVQGIVIDESAYSIQAERGLLTWVDESLLPVLLSQMVVSDLLVVISALGDEVKGSLSQNRLENVNASSFSKGTLSSRHLKSLSHRGSLRYRSPLSLEVSKSLMPNSQRLIFSPVIDGSLLQYSSNVAKLARTSLGDFTLSTVHGLISSSDCHSGQALGYNPDFGAIIDFQDELKYSDGSNAANTFWVLSSQGLYYSQNGGSAFDAIPNPKRNEVEDFLTCFSVATESTIVWPEDGSSSSPTENYSTSLYAGGDYLWMASYTDFDLSPYAWAQIINFRSSAGIVNYEDVGQIRALCEIATVNTSGNPDSGADSLDKTLYVASSTGLYAGTTSSLMRVFSGDVLGLYWVRSGLLKNCLVWWTGDSVYVSVSAEEIIGEDSSSWQHPFESWLSSSSSFSSVATVSVEPIVNLASGAPLVVSGRTVANGDRILVAGQTTAAQNGIYTVTTAGSGANGVWARSSDLDAANEFVAYKTVSVQYGLYASSEWYLKSYDGTFVVGTTSNYWSQKQLSLISSPGKTIASVLQRPNTDELFVAFEDALARIEYQSENNVVVSSNQWLPWDIHLQGTLNSLQWVTNGQSIYSDQIYAGSSFGTWKSLDTIYTDLEASNVWRRPVYSFATSTNITVFDKDLNEVIPDDIYVPYQQAVFSNPIDQDERLCFEDDYRIYSTEPWESSGADVLIEVDGEPSRISYALDSEKGTVTFASSLSKSKYSDASITIWREGAFLNNVGSTPHEEISSVQSVSSDPIAQLAQDFAPSDTIIYLTSHDGIVAGWNYLELRQKTTIERIYAYAYQRNGQFVIQLPYARSSTTTFKSGSFVYAVNSQELLGIQDYLTLDQDALTYHLSSVVAGNVLSLTHDLKDVFSFWESYDTPAKAGTTARRGLVNVTSIDWNDPNQYDVRNTRFTQSLGFEPSYDSVVPIPSTYRRLYNVSASGGDMRVATNSGVYVCNNQEWTLESNLDYETPYFLGSSSQSGLCIGTSDGLWNKSSDGWAKNPWFNQPVYALESGNWGDYQFVAYGKSDGMSIQIYSQGSLVLSDYSKLAANTKVFGMRKDQFIRLGTDTSGGVTQTSKDAIYLCTESGVIGVTGDVVVGSNSSFASFLVERDMFGADSPTRDVTQIDGTITKQKVKFLKAFRCAATPRENGPSSAVPLMFLTDNGIYSVRNWRWCDPAAANGLTFVVESHNLSGMHCYSYATGTSSGNPGISKTFVGTNKGVYRSFNEGLTWQPCERIFGGDTVVYDLVYDGHIWAATDKGIFVSDDDGDTWESPSADSSLATFPGHTAPFKEFEGNWLAQVFAVTESTDVIRANVYFTLNDGGMTIAQKELASNNYVQFWIYQTSGGLPDFTQSPVAYMGTLKIDDLIGDNLLPADFTTSSLPEALRAIDVTHPRMYSVYLTATLAAGTYALAAKETVAPGASPVFLWGRKSATAGNSCSYVSNVWQKNTNWDFFFTLDYASPGIASPTIVASGYYSGDIGWRENDFSRGVLVTNTGELTGIPAIAGTFMLDASSSVPSADLSASQAAILQIVGGWSDFGGGSEFLAGLDLWSYGRRLTNSTLGYSFNAAEFTSLLNSIQVQGYKSPLNQYTQYVSSGVNKQSVADSVVKSASIITSAVSYLDGLDAIDLDALKSYYANEDGYVVNLSLKIGSTAGDATVDLSANKGVSTFTWDENAYLYLELFADGVLINSSEYTYIGSEGSVTFTTPLDFVGTVITGILRKDWDGTVAGISSSAVASLGFAMQYAEAFHPVVMIVSDGWDDGEVSTASILDDLKYSWDDNGLDLNVVDLSGYSSNMYELGTGSYHSTSSWPDVVSFMVNQAQALRGLWSKSYDFSEPKMIESIEASVRIDDASTVGACLIEARFTQDNVNWTNWTALADQSVVDAGAYSTYAKKLDISQLIYGLEYRVTLSPGVTIDDELLYPRVQALYHTEISPAIQYVVSNEFTEESMICEALVSYPWSDAPIEWSIVRSAVPEYRFSEKLHTNRYSVLPLRTKSIQYRDEVVQEKLKTTTTDQYRYTVVDASGNVVNWLSTDTIKVYVDSIATPVDSSEYSVDIYTSSVVFYVERLSQSAIYVTITTPTTLERLNGEACSSVDQFTYWAKNGAWPYDASVVVLVNGSAIQGGYWLSPEQGSVTFKKPFSEQDRVSLYIQHGESWRVIGKVLNYSDSGYVPLHKMTFQHSVRPYPGVLNEASTPAVPQIVGPVNLLPDTASIYDRLRVEYEYFAPDNSQESNTSTMWYRQRGLDPDFYALEPASDIVDHTGAVVDYRGRTVQKLSDVGVDHADALFKEGDFIKVEVTVSNGVFEGLPVMSDPVELTAAELPYIKAASVNASKSPEGNIFANQDLKAYYIFNANQGGSDELFNGRNGLSVVSWFTNESAQAIYEGPILPASYVTKGRVISFSVLPKVTYNSITLTGVACPSDEVLVG